MQVFVGGCVWDSEGSSEEQAFCGSGYGFLLWFVLNPIRIFCGSFGSETLFRNGAYVSPNEIRSDIARDRGEDYRNRIDTMFIIIIHNLYFQIFCCTP